MTEEEYTKTLKELMKKHNDDPDKAIVEYGKLPDGKRVDIELEGEKSSYSLKAKVSMRELHGVDIEEELIEIMKYEKEHKEVRNEV